MAFTEYNSEDYLFIYKVVGFPYQSNICPLEVSKRQAYKKFF